VAGSTLRLVDPATGVELYSVGPDTWPMLNKLDLGWPVVRTTSTPISGAHGETDTTRYFGARAITAEVTLPQGVAADAALDVLGPLQDPGLRLWLYAQRPGWAGERRIMVRGGGLPCPPGTVRVAQASWVAPAGLFEDAAPSSVTLVPSASASGGFAFPMSFPLTLSAGLVPGASLVDVSGMPVAPVIDIFGPCSDPLVRCVDTGEQVAFTGFSIADGDYLQVDMAARTALLNGDPAQSRYNRLDFTSSTWWKLPVGVGVRLVFSPTAPSGACQAVVTWHSQRP
jgi:hypothetical protein